MDFTENRVLFGADTTERIVAVEFSDPEIWIYRRGENGETLVEKEAFRPFLWSSEPVAGAEKLAGDLVLDHLSELDSWSAWENLRNDLKKNGLPYFALTDPVQQYLTRTGRTLFKGMELADVRRMQLDIETACAEGYEFSQAERDPILGIALADNSGWEEWIPVHGGEAGEGAALEQLQEIILQRDPDVIEGHNIFKFDLPYLAKRAKRCKVKMAWGRGGALVRSRNSRIQIAEKLIQFPRFGIPGRHVVDTFFLTQLYDISSRELPGFGLKTVARYFRIAEPDRVILEGNEIQRAATEDPEALRTYALQDVRETRALAELLSGSYFTQAQIFPYNYEDIILRGNATRIDSIFLREYLRQGHSVSNPPEGRSFEGGYTDIFKTGVIRDVWHCDVTSLYPSVMLAFDYVPEHDSLGVFKNLLQDLRSFRIEAKRLSRQAELAEERLRAETLQTTFKILINSFYGYLGFAQGHFADFTAASAVTAKGREILRQMVELLQQSGGEVIEIDTDGIYFHPAPETSQETLEQIMREHLPSGIEVEFGKRFRAMFSYKAKNYALLDEAGNLTLKGAALKSRGMERYLRDYLEELIRMMLEEKFQEAAELSRKYESRLRNREWPVEMFMKSEALQDSLASYQRKIGASSRNRSAAFELAVKSGRDYQAGDMISYYITGTKARVTAYENAQLATEWNEVSRDENVDYYVLKLRELEKKFSAFLPDPDGLGI